jgi:hypothetical protein
VGLELASPIHLSIFTGRGILLEGVKDNTIYIRKCYEVWLEFPDPLRKLVKLVGCIRMAKYTLNQNPTAKTLLLPYVEKRY